MKKRFRSGKLVQSLFFILSLGLLANPAKAQDFELNPFGYTPRETFSFSNRVIDNYRLNPNGYHPGDFELSAIPPRDFSDQGTFLAEERGEASEKEAKRQARKYLRGELRDLDWYDHLEAWFHEQRERKLTLKVGPRVNGGDGFDFNDKRRSDTKKDKEGNRRRPRVMKIRPGMHGLHTPHIEIQLRNPANYKAVGEIHYNRFELDIESPHRPGGFTPSLDASVEYEGYSRVMFRFSRTF